MGYLCIAGLKPGMILNKDISLPDYRLPLATKGMHLTEELIKRIANLGIYVVNVHHSLETTNQIVQETTIILKNIFDRIDFVSQKDYIRLLPSVEKIVNLIHNCGQNIIDELYLLWQVDQYTLHHSIGTAFYSALIATQLGYNDKKLKDIVVGSLLHDLGKGIIAEEILTKPGMLDSHEFIEIQKHCLYGYKILQETSELSEEIMLIPLQHHERLDGTGYPQRLKSDDIHEYAKIVSIADSFSALTTDRIYRKKVSKFVAAEYLQGACGTGFDKYLVNVFLYAIFGNITGSWVELSNGELAIVKSLNYSKPMRPIIAVSYGGQIVREIDLAKTPGLYIRNFRKKT